MHIHVCLNLNFFFVLFFFEKLFQSSYLAPFFPLPVFFICSHARFPDEIFSFPEKIAFTINLSWTLFFQERRIFHLEWAKGKQQNWQWSFSQNVGRFLHVTLAGLVRFEMMYLCKELSLLNSLFANVND